jgi:hypothetical protein
MISSQSGAPKDYAELYEEYFDFMKSIVRRVGINAEDVEDVTSEILCKFMEKDALTWYDPEFVVDVGDKPRTQGPRQRHAKFSNLLKSFTFTHCLAWRDKQNNFVRREPHFAKMDAPVSGEEGTQTWGEHHASTLRVAHDLEVSVEYRLLLRMAIYEADLSARYAAEDAEDSVQTQVWRMRKKAAEEARKRAEGVRGAVRLAGRGELVTGKSLAEECGWSKTVGTRILRGVRQELRAAGL